jgi:hypothetical protein
LKIFDLKGKVALVHPNDIEGRRLIAAERFQRLRGDARPARTVGATRRRLGALLVTAGARLAPDEVPRTTSTRQSVL